MRGDKRLVCSHHVLAIGDCLAHQMLGVSRATNQLDNNVYLRVIDDFLRVGHHRNAIQRASPWFGQILGGYLMHCDPAPGASGYFFAVIVQHSDRAGTHGAQAEYSDAYRR